MIRQDSRSSNHAHSELPTKPTTLNHRFHVTPAVSLLPTMLLLLMAVSHFSILHADAFRNSAITATTVTTTTTRNNRILAFGQAPCPSFILAPTVARQAAEKGSYKCRQKFGLTRKQQSQSQQLLGPLFQQLNSDDNDVTSEKQDEQQRNRETEGVQEQQENSEEEEEEEGDVAGVDAEAEEEEQPWKDPKMERAWRYAKKPLLRIGSKGANLSHGNSLRQLLDSHTVVKVKVNTHTRRLHDSYQAAFEQLRDLAVESGASPDIELLQYRSSEKVILFGLPGTLERIQKGEFPPPDREFSTSKSSTRSAKDEDEETNKDGDDVQDTQESKRTK